MTLLLMLFSSAVPSPMYVIYQQRWHFSPTMLTVIFGVYALVVLLSLWLFGSLSDSVGRRPVLIVSLLLGIAALVLFVTASGVDALLAARVVQGLSVGLATGTLSAALVDLAPAKAPGRAATVNGVAPMLGLATGALVTGLLVQYAPAPTVLSYLVPLLAFAAVMVAIVVMPERSAAGAGTITLRPRRVSIPAHTRKPFALLSLAAISAWAVSGFYLSLVPSVLAGALGVASHLIAGLTIAVLAGAAALGQLALGGLPARTVAAIGLGATVVATAVIYESVNTATVGLFFLGTALLGVACGATFLGTIRLLTEIAEPARRGEMFAALYVVNYLAFSVPALIAGVLTDTVGLRPMAALYLGFIAVVSVAALAGVRFVSGHVASTNPVAGGTMEP